jgi:glycine dehydrogenase
MSGRPLDDLEVLEGHDSFVARHIAASEAEIAAMLAVVGAPSLDTLAERTVPAAIRDLDGLDLPAAIDEAGVIAELRGVAQQNTPIKSLI